MHVLPCLTGIAADDDAPAAAADMPECKEWDTMCTADPTLFACSTHPAAAGGATPKPMAMDGRSAAAGNATAAAPATTARSGAAAAAVQVAFVLVLCVFASALVV
jgi:hypothetical protein